VDGSRRRKRVPWPLSESGSYSGPVASFCTRAEMRHYTARRSRNQKALSTKTRSDEGPRRKQPRINTDGHGCCGLGEKIFLPRKQGVARWSYEENGVRPSRVPVPPEFSCFLCYSWLPPGSGRQTVSLSYQVIFLRFLCGGRGRGVGCAGGDDGIVVALGPGGFGRTGPRALSSGGTGIASLGSLGGVAGWAALCG
jgi:hypothetical protein